MHRISENDSTLDPLSCEFGFDLFFAVAIFTLHRDKIFLCTDGSQVHQYISRFVISGRSNEVFTDYSIAA